MKQPNPRRVVTRRILVFGALLLVLSAVLLFWARDVVREVFVLPISYLIFVTGIFIKSVPQMFVWLSLLVIAIAIALNSITARKKTMAPPLPQMVELAYNPPSEGRVAYWAYKVRLFRAGGSAFYQANFHLSLARMLVELIAHRYHITQYQAEERLRHGTLDLPPEVMEYARSALSRQEVIQTTFAEWFRQAIVERVRSWLRITTGQSPIQRTDDAGYGVRLAVILRYMEEELEVSHDSDNR
jgi:hypothetical protein